MAASLGARRSRSARRSVRRPSRSRERRVLRVLHDVSFIDDPTRILRGITYEARYGFRFDEHTAALARGCIEIRTRRRPVVVTATGRAGRTARGSWSRRTESADSASSVSTRAIHPHLRGDDEAAALFARCDCAAGRARLDVPSWRLGLAALARDDDSRRGVRLARPAQGPPQARRADRRRGHLWRPASSERLRSEPLDPAQRRGARGPVRTGRAARRARAGGPARAARLLRAASERASRDRRCRSHRPGRYPNRRRSGEILAEIRTRKLNGELDGREAELAAARELVAASAPA